MIDPEEPNFEHYEQLEELAELNDQAAAAMDSVLGMLEAIAGMNHAVGRTTTSKPSFDYLVDLHQHCLTPEVTIRWPRAHEGVEVMIVRYLGEAQVLAHQSAPNN